MILEYLLSLISLYLVIVTIGVVHVLLYKRDARSALGWIGLILVFPVAGALLYLLFGINRVRRKARRISLRVEPEGGWRRAGLLPEGGACLDNVGFAITGLGLKPGNSVHCYHDGEEAFPAMLDAIQAARREVLLSSYIFDNDSTGQQFVDALASARDRGVDVRVLIDDVGMRYSFPTVARAFRKAGLEFRRFMPLRLIPPSLSLNLRTHRKLLITDRTLAFAGGMNIGDRQLARGHSRHRASDLHFGFEGPAVGEFVRLFEEDWRFMGGEKLSHRQARTVPAGDAEVRVISDGPDETLDSLALLIGGTIGRARQRAWIMTPYFLPDRALTGCLQAAALSGVDVRVMIPETNNWPVVQWALQHTMAELLIAGVRILRRPAPFAHSKCIIIDEDYALVGSSNLDPRSLRLNFEVGVEVFDPALNEHLATHFEALVPTCSTYTMPTINARSTPVRLRDAAAALFSPYL
ncbi:phospholipase D-like domain-containing protein [Elongatibacter sediminis]|uniref:Phospholipase D-like domain-containing protein n=1 Tax=Elongatibacter sediminis TaxID=3119006 RepID=A0AAW9RBE0_9GAMM